MKTNTMVVMSMSILARFRSILGILTHILIECEDLNILSGKQNAKWNSWLL